jgi:hypothetical protein
MPKAFKHLAHFTVEGLTFAFALLIPGPPPLNADEGFSRIAALVRDRLVQLGLARDSLFLDCGVDEQAEGCELMFTPIFIAQDSGRRAAQGLDRPHWVIASSACACPNGAREPS